MSKLAQPEIEQRLESFPEWSTIGDAIQRTYGFEDFAGAMEFVNRVAELAERHQHHPDILVRYNKVTLTISTHDAGGLTDKDFGLAKDLDQMLSASERRG